MYEYEPIPDRYIRLLSLKFDEDIDALRLSISVHPIDKPPVYKALSYVWGDASDRVNIVILDEENLNEHTVSITKSLYRALRRLRLGHCNAYIWADALCINQGDNKEKSKQVRMMTEIYARANSVFGWLGESRQGDDDGLGLLRIIARTRRAESEEARTRAMEYLLAEATYPSWAALWEIFMLPWFRRVWIIQEIVVSVNFHFLCGEEMIAGDDFFTAIEIIATNPDIGNVFLYSTTAANRERLTTSSLYEMRECYRNPQKRSIQNFLGNSGKYEATDPRDKVFALIALSNDVDTSFIDYELDGGSVFRLMQSLQLRIPGASTQTLGFGCMGKYFEGLPSWVCQWRIDGETDRIPLHVIYPTISAPENLANVVQKVDGVYNLAISAVIFDSIKEYVPWTTVPLVPDQTVQRLAGAPCSSQVKQYDAERMGKVLQGQAVFLHKCVQLVQKLAVYPTGQNLDEVLWRAYLFDTTIHGETPAPISYGPLFRKLVRCLALLRSLDLFDLFGSGKTKFPDKGPINVIQLEILLLSMILIFCWRKALYPKTIWYWIILTLTIPIVLVFWRVCLYYILSELPLKRSRRLKFAMQWPKVKDGMVLAGVGVFGRLREGRNFGITHKGYVGWFPMTAQKGDILCFLRHSDVPFVLRKTESTGTYTLVGDSYIQGLMNGSRSSIANIVSAHIRIR
jgi:hypothetical protein